MRTRIYLGRKPLSLRARLLVVGVLAVAGAALLTTAIVARASPTTAPAAWDAQIRERAAP